MAGEQGAARLFVELALQSTLRQELDQELAGAQQKVSSWQSLAPALAQKFDTTKARAELLGLKATLARFEQENQQAIASGQQFQVNLKTLGRDTATMSRGVSAMGSSLLGVQMVLSSMGGSFGEREKAVVGMSGAMITLGSAGTMASTEMKAMATVMTGTVIPAMRACGAAAYAALGPWGLLAAGAAAVITAYVAYSKWSETAANKTETLTSKIDAQARSVNFLQSAMRVYTDQVDRVETKESREEQQLSRLHNQVEAYTQALKRSKDAKEELADLALTLEGDELAVIRARQRLKEMQMTPGSTQVDIAEASHNVRVAEATRERDRTRQVEQQQQVTSSQETIAKIQSAEGVTTLEALQARERWQAGMVTRVSGLARTLQVGQTHRGQRVETAQSVQRALEIEKEWQETPPSEGFKRLIAQTGAGTPEYSALERQAPTTFDTSMWGIISHGLAPRPGERAVRTGPFEIAGIDKPNPAYLQGFSQGRSIVVNNSFTLKSDDLKDRAFWESLGDLIGKKVYEVIANDNRASGVN